MSQSLLTLICPPSLERPITDWLLEQKDVFSFTSMQVYGHGNDPNFFNLAEQVEGRKKQIMFQMHIASEITEFILNNLKQDFKGTDIHYWLIPFIDNGNLSV